MQHMAVFDTNILIDLFNNRHEAADALDNTASHCAISLITWMEVMVGARKYGQEAKTAAVMGAFEIIDVSREIAQRSVLLRVQHEYETAGCHYTGHCSNQTLRAHFTQYQGFRRH